MQCALSISELQIRRVKLISIDRNFFVSWPNPMFDHFTKSYVWPLVRIVSMRRFYQVVKHRIWSRNRRFRNENTHLIWSPGILLEIIQYSKTSMFSFMIENIFNIFTVNSACNDIWCNDIPHVTIQVCGPYRSPICFTLLVYNDIRL